MSFFVGNLLRMICIKWPKSIKSYAYESETVMPEVFNLYTILIIFTHVYILFLLLQLIYYH